MHARAAKENEVAKSGETRHFRRFRRFRRFLRVPSAKAEFVSKS